MEEKSGAEYYEEYKKAVEKLSDGAVKTNEEDFVKQMAFFQTIIAPAYGKHFKRLLDKYKESNKRIAEHRRKLFAGDKPGR